MLVDDEEPACLCRNYKAVGRIGSRFATIGENPYPCVRNHWVRWEGGRTRRGKAIALPPAIEEEFGIDEGDVFVSRANTIELVGLSAVAIERPKDRLIYARHD
jgi:hypothetical protein